jgi:histidine kinase
VIIDEDHPGIFAKDRYIRKTRPKSVACAPILTQGVPIGVLYLENTLVAGIFTPERLEVVYLLANRLAPVKAPADVSVQTGVDQKLPTGEYLTEREAEILRLISRGLSNKEIGDRLGLTINTVKTHIKSLYSKLGVHGRVQALKRGQERGLL